MTYSIFGNKEKAIKMSIERFDDETRESFLSLYSKIDAEVGMTDEEKEVAEAAREVLESAKSDEDV